MENNEKKMHADIRLKELNRNGHHLYIPKRIFFAIFHYSPLLNSISCCHQSHVHNVIRSRSDQRRHFTLKLVIYLTVSD